ncbi:unnamed protein product [Brassica oleracea var. botrytis]
MANWLLRLPQSLFATISFAVSRFFFLFLSYYQFQLHRSLRSSLMVVHRLWAGLSLFYKFIFLCHD